MTDGLFISIYGSMSTPVGIEEFSFQYRKIQGRALKIRFGGHQQARGSKQTGDSEPEQYKANVLPERCSTSVSETLKEKQKAKQKGLHESQPDTEKSSQSNVTEALSRYIW